MAPHRRTGAGALPYPSSETAAGDGRPDPHAVATAAGFVEALRQLRSWAGVGFRRLEKRAANLGMVLPRSTITAALKREVLPREELVVALVRACGGDQNDAGRWVAARRRIAAGTSQPWPSSASTPPVREVTGRARQGRGGSAAAGARSIALDRGTPADSQSGVLPLPPQRPHDMARLSGQMAQLKLLLTVASRPAGSAVVISTIEAMVTTDKTTFEVHAGHHAPACIVIYV
ncbi:hypothetical protein [Allorhizocola rhizosphaerae]|uniref:hypothetical protein n=1 Tax=Allorhizocola rhizosphaerae TaxID=1872709 RepID=UPI0013C2DCCB|nr:hypothetical protein [Allorhizocola rhizosphaerae]